VRHDNPLARPYISYTQSDRVDIVLTNPPFGGKEEDGIESNFPKQFQTRETADLFLALIVRLLKKDGPAGVVLPDGTLFGEGACSRCPRSSCAVRTGVRTSGGVEGISVFRRANVAAIAHARRSPVSLYERERAQIS
jgi:type I restriction enzyme M protein